MKSKILTILLLIATTIFVQKEGQSFCNGDSTETYFPLLKEKKHYSGTALIMKKRK